jgi:hypothetical protein
MAIQPESTVFESLLQSALAKYEKETGIPLVDNPLMAQLNDCDSVETITQALQNRAQAFREFRGGNHEAIKFLKRTVQALYKLSGTASLVESIGLVCRNGFLSSGIVISDTCSAVGPYCENGTYLYRSIP